MVNTKDSSPLVVALATKVLKAGLFAEDVTTLLKNMWNLNADIRDEFFEFMLDDSQNFSEYEQMIINKRRGAK